MFKVVKIYSALLVFVTFCLECAIGVSCAGCVDLDEISFNKTINRFAYAIVKFDIAFPYGDKHIAYGEFSSVVHRTTDELLVATVGIKDYGEMENKELGLRFGFDDKSRHFYKHFCHNSLIFFQPHSEKKKKSQCFSIKEKYKFCIDFMMYLHN